MFRSRVGAKLIAEGLTAVQAHIVVAEIPRRITLPGTTASQKAVAATVDALSGSKRDPAVARFDRLENRGAEDALWNGPTDLFDRRRELPLQPPRNPLLTRTISQPAVFDFACSPRISERLLDKTLDIRPTIICVISRSSKRD
jgi:hypothetical protein